MSLVDLIHSIAMGSRRLRAILTPVGLVIFGLSLLVVVLVGLWLDQILRIDSVLSWELRLSVGLPILGIGSALCGWCVVRFRRAAGTPVPFNPPTELVVSGPYRWSRNPMLTAVFTALFGLGVVLHSAGMVIVTIPAYVLLHVIELKLVEEPELERRFGTSYSEYRRNVPMFWPRPWRM